MLDKLKTSTRLLETARKAAASPREALGKAVGIVMDGARRAVGSVVGTAKEVLHGADRSSVREWMYELSQLSTDERQARLFDTFSEAINSDFSLFYDLLEKLSGVDLIRYAEGKKGRGELLSDTELFAPLEVDYDIFISAINAAQGSSNFEEWKAFVDEKKSEQEVPDDEEIIDFTGASIPTLFPKIQKYQKAVIDYAERHVLDRSKIFDQLTDVFKRISGEVFGDKMEGFYTKGTSEAFIRMVNRMDKKFPATEYIFSPYEYLPMDYITDDKRRHVVDVDGGVNFKEEDLVAAMLKKGDAIISARADKACLDPVILGISTQPRMGGRLLDVDKIVALVDAENARLGRKAYHLWFDTSQDSRVINKGDVVFVSKRFATSGGGAVFINNETYPVDENDIKEAVRVRGGYEVKTIPQLIASLACQKNRYGHEFGQLLSVPTLWNYKGKGRYLHQEVDTAMKDLESFPLLKRFFVLEGEMLPVDGEHWNIDAILRLVPTEEGRQKIDLKALEVELKKRKVNLLSFNLSECEDRRPNAPTFSKLKACFDGNPFDLAQFIAIANKFEDYYKDRFVRNLLPQDDLSEGSVRAHFEAAMKEHDYFRVFITAVQSQGTLNELLCRLDQILSGMPNLVT